MSWKKLDNISQIEEIVNESKEKPVLVFKHSSRCSISSVTWNRFERNWKKEDSEKISPYFLDLIAFREVSNAVAETFKVPHASPQVILIKDGKAVYANSHMGINYQDLLANTN